MLPLILLFSDLSWLISSHKKNAAPATPPMASAGNLAANCVDQRDQGTFRVAKEEITLP